MKKSLITVVTAAAAITLTAADILHQGFENPKFFAARNPNHYTIAPLDANGKWCKMTEKHVSDEQAAEGKYSFKFTRGEKTEPIEVIFPPSSGPVELEIWFYREPENNFVLTLIGEKLSDGYLAGLGVWDKSRQFAYFDTAEKKWKRTGLKVPAEEWRRIVFRFNDDRSRVAVLTGDADQLDQLAEVTPPAGVPLRRMWFSIIRDGAIGSSTYFDELKLSPIKKSAGK